MLWRTTPSFRPGGKTPPQAPQTRPTAALFPLGALLAIGCASAPASEVGTRPVIANATLARVEDRSLHARLGGSAAIAAIAGYWAEQTQARTRLPYEHGVARAQYLLDCTIGRPGSEPPRPEPPSQSPPPSSALLLHDDTPTDLLFDLRHTLQKLHITAPEREELLERLRQFLSERKR
jgi:hypothetical protein